LARKRLQRNPKGKKMQAARKQALKSVVALPYYPVSLFTSAKSFRDNPLIGSRILNMLGLHVARLALSHAVFGFKLALMSFLVDREDAKAYRRDGFVVKKDFLPADVFAALKKEAEDYDGEAWQCVQGDTVTWRALFSPDMLEKHPACKKLAEDRSFLRLLKFTGGKNERPILYIQQIQNGHANEGAADPQKVLHADTFHPTMKAWLFLEDVTPENGPFTYVRGSNRLTWKRLAWEYRRSIRARGMKDGYSEKGSFRVEESELQDLGLPAPEALSVPANTLVIASTYGFHRRGDTTSKQATRLEIWALSRVNPFNPFPGLGVKTLADLRDRAYLAYLRHTDKKMRAKGKRASWHQAPPSPR
jgi:hypothetical protein